MKCLINSYWLLVISGGNDRLLKIPSVTTTNN